MRPLMPDSPWEMCWDFMGSTLQMEIIERRVQRKEKFQSDKILKS